MGLYFLAIDAAVEVGAVVSVVRRRHRALPFGDVEDLAALVGTGPAGWLEQLDEEPI